MSRRPVSGKFIASAVAAGVVLAGYGGHAAASTTPASGTVPSGTLGCTGLEQLWDDAGGPAGAAETAAAIAMAESSGDQYALSNAPDGTQGYSYWQIETSNDPGSYDPMTNAREAVALYERDGWEPWVTYQTGAYEGQC